MGVLLVGKKFKEEKLRLYNAQNGLCKLCGRPLNVDIYSNHLDHDHAITGDNAGKVRSLLCNLCNGLEGQIKHKFVSSGLNSKNVNIAEWLRTLADYYEDDYSESNYHPNYIKDKVKWFSRLNKPEMIDELLLLNADITGDRATLTATYKKALRLSILATQH